MADNSNDTAIRSLGAQVANLAIGKAYAEQESADKDTVIEELQGRILLLEASLGRSNARLAAHTDIIGEEAPDGETPDQ